MKERRHTDSRRDVDPDVVPKARRLVTAFRAHGLLLPTQQAYGLATADRIAGLAQAWLPRMDQLA